MRVSHHLLRAWHHDSHRGACTPKAPTPLEDCHFSQHMFLLCTLSSLSDLLDMLQNPAHSMLPSLARLPLPTCALITLSFLHHLALGPIPGFFILSCVSWDRGRISFASVVPASAHGLVLGRGDANANSTFPTSHPLSLLWHKALLVASFQGPS